jgi:hypothetical protein
VLVAGIIYGIMISSQRLQRTASARMDSQQTARTAALFLTQAMRELDAYSEDLLAATDTSLTYRAMRWTGMTCTPLSGDLTVGIRRTQLWGASAPTVDTDSVLVYLERDPNTRNDDIWVIGELSGTPGSPTTCTDGTPAFAVSFRVRGSDGGNSAVTAGFRAGAPIRGFQHEQVTNITQDGQRWLGRRTMAKNGTWSGWEALVGPLVATNGLRFVMRDTTSTVTTAVGSAASVEFVIRSLSRETGWFGGTNARLADSIITRVAIRNNDRF